MNDLTVSAWDCRRRRAPSRHILFGRRRHARRFDMTLVKRVIAATVLATALLAPLHATVSPTAAHAYIEQDNL